MTQTPRFRELLDWKEGRLDQAAAADVAARAQEHHEAVSDDLAWIEQFLVATQVMPLQVPPASVAAGARAAFRSLRSNPHDPRMGSLGIDFDSRDQPLAGVRSGATSLARRVRASAPGLHLTLDLVPAGERQVEASGTVTLQPGDGARADEWVVAVQFLASGEVRHTLAVNSEGGFSSMITPGSDAVCVITSARRLDARLDTRADADPETDPEEGSGAEPDPENEGR